MNQKKGLESVRKKIDSQVARCRLARARRADSILMDIAHDVCTYMRAWVIKDLEIFCLIWFNMDILNNLMLAATFIYREEKELKQVRRNDDERGWNFL